MISGRVFEVTPNACDYGCVPQKNPLGELEMSPGQLLSEISQSGLPTQRGNVSLSNLQVLNAILYVAEHGGK